MCEEKQTCLCHLLRPAIQKDKESDLKLAAFFHTKSNDELYFFLQDSYTLQKLTNDEFKTNLLQLKVRFIGNESPDQINLSQVEQRSFINQYDSYLEGECNEENMKIALAKIIKGIEKLAYINLYSLEGFDNHLNQYNDNPVNNDEACCKCLCF